MNGRSASQFDARTKRLAETSHCVHSGAPITSTRPCHWCSSMQSAKIQSPSLHWNMSIGWIGRLPQRITGISEYVHVASTDSRIEAMHAWTEISMCCPPAPRSRPNSAPIVASAALTPPWYAAW